MTRKLFTYRTVVTTAAGKYTEKGSKFYAYAFPMQSVGDLEKKLSSIRSDQARARHFCYAYRIVSNGIPVEYSSDAGEPSGSAGTPILNALRSEEVFNTGVIVARHFGGTKLGIPGLIHAYRSSAEDALRNSTMIMHTRRVSYLMTAPIALQPIILESCKRHGIEVSNPTYSETFSLILNLPLQHHRLLLLQLLQSVSGRELGTVEEYTAETGLKIKKSSHSPS